MAAALAARCGALWRALPGNARGALWMLAAALLFSLMALLVKALGRSIDTIEVALFRCLVGLVVLLPFIAALGGRELLRTRHLRIHLTRAVFGIVAMLCSYYAIARLPLAAYTALSFTRPLFATVLAVIILGETVRWRRWGATLAGFGGVLLMMRPGAEAFDPAALFALGDALSIALLITLIKRVSAHEHPLAMLFYFGLFSVPLAAVPTAFVWTTPTLEQALILLGIGTVGALAQGCFICAFRAGEASAVAPFDYLRLLFAGLAGFLAFAEVPDGWMLAGAAVIIASTLYIARREARLGRAAPVAEGELKP
jgi:drug/metabolite transporter (DMT)-like permease